jgi:hypothetical protein
MAGHLSSTTADDDRLPVIACDKSKAFAQGSTQRSNPNLRKTEKWIASLRSLRRYFFTLLASILTDGSSILTENAVSTSNGFSMPR